MEISENTLENAAVSGQSSQQLNEGGVTIAVPRRARVSAVAANKPGSDRKRRSYSWASKQR